MAGLEAAASWELRLLEDQLSAGGTVALPEDGVNRVAYVAHGGIAVEGGRGEFADDSAWHGRGAAKLRAGPHGAALWRFELAPAGAPVVAGDGRTLEKLRAPLDGGLLPEGPLLMRCDSVAFPPAGCAFLHTH